MVVLGSNMNFCAKLLSIACLSAAGASLAHAADFQLQPGQWEITEGMSLSANATPTQTRSICITANENLVSENWFIDLAKPNAGCASDLTSVNASQLQFSLNCPSRNGDIEGPVNVNVSASEFTISSDLALQLGGHPLPMHRQLTARNVGQCP